MDDIKYIEVENEEQYVYDEIYRMRGSDYRLNVVARHEVERIKLDFKQEDLCERIGVYTDEDYYLAYKSVRKFVTGVPEIGKTEHHKAHRQHEKYGVSRDRVQILKENISVVESHRRIGKTGVSTPKNGKNFENPLDKQRSVCYNMR